MNVRRGLGRGLGALIPPAPASEDETSQLEYDAASSEITPPEEGHSEATVAAGAGQAASGADKEAPSGGQREVEDAYFAEVPVESISPNPRQPRAAFDEEGMAELVYSIKEIGLLQPIVVRKVTDAAHELVMGERRWRAARQAELETIPAIVRQTDDDAMLRDALIENLHRTELNPLEEAAAYGQLLDDFGCTHDELAQRIGRSRPQITNTLRLLKLSATVQRRVAAGVLSAGHARALVGLSSGDAQDRLAQRTVAEGLSVRALEEAVAVADETESSSRQPRRPKPVSPRLSELGDRLSERFDTRVKVELGKNRGKITVEFASLDDLDRIVTLMDPPSSASDQSPPT